MEESPVEALRNKPASSLASIVMMQKERTVEGIFSAGNTVPLLPPVRFTCECMKVVDPP